ncbi:methyltransferase [Acidilobus sp.]|uniref:methyltransferase n=1 Tax=Acidilobus sp. TaxID=1872109 RepID=UPI003D06B2C2
MSEPRWAEITTAAGRLRVALSRCVYEPSDDSLLAIEAMVKLKEMGRTYEAVLDLGTGSGVLALASSLLFRPRRLAAVDISPYAVECARATLGPDAAVIQCNGAKCLNNRWDLVILNPPYLPSSEVPRDECDFWEFLAWSEGTNHERLCRDAAEVGNEVLIVRSSLSSFNVDSCLRDEGLHMDGVLASRRFFMEELRVELWNRFSVKK